MSKGRGRPKFVERSEVKHQQEHIRVSPELKTKIGKLRKKIDFSETTRQFWEKLCAAHLA